MTEANKSIGKTIRNMRKAKGMTLAQLAAATGRSETMLGQIERGKVNTTVRVLHEISSALDCYIDIRLVHH